MKYNFFFLKKISWALLSESSIIHLLAGFRNNKRFYFKDYFKDFILKDKGK